MITRKFLSDKEEVLNAHLVLRIIWGSGKKKKNIWNHYPLVGMDPSSLPSNKQINKWKACLHIWKEVHSGGRGQHEVRNRCVCKNKLSWPIYILKNRCQADFQFLLKVKRIWQHEACTLHRPYSRRLTQPYQFLSPIQSDVSPSILPVQVLWFSNNRPILHSKPSWLLKVEKLV